MSEFVNRESSNLNKKKLEVVKNSVVRDEAGELVSFIVKEYREDNEPSVEGTALNSENLNRIVKDMINNVVSVLPLSDDTIVAIDKMYLNVPTTAAEDFELPLIGELGSYIEWTSSNTSTIEISDSTAIVTRELVDKIVTLTATTSKGAETEEKIFSVTVPKRATADLEIATYDSEHIIVPEYVTGSFTLPSIGSKGSTVIWTAAITDGASLSGNIVTVNRGTYNSGIILSGKFQYGSSSVSKRFDVTVIGTDCFAPKNLSSSITQSIGILKSIDVTITTQTLEGLYVIVENDNDDKIEFQITGNDSNSVKLTICETEDLNALRGSGSYSYGYKVKVYLNSNHSLLLGTIDGEFKYYLTSTTPED